LLRPAGALSGERAADPPRFGTLAAGAALGLGVVGDQLLRGDPPGLGFGLWIAAIVVALELLSRARGLQWTPAQRLLALPILFFAETIAWRDAGGLAALDIAAALLAAALLSE